MQFLVSLPPLFFLWSGLQLLQSVMFVLSFVAVVVRPSRSQRQKKEIQMTQQQKIIRRMIFSFWRGGKRFLLPPAPIFFRPIPLQPPSLSEPSTRGTKKQKEKKTGSKEKVKMHQRRTITKKVQKKVTYIFLNTDLFVLVVALLFKNPFSKIRFQFPVLGE